MEKKAVRATKIQTLLFIRSKEVVGTSDLVEKFGYSPNTARNKLNRLAKKGLLEKVSVESEAYCLTVEAYRRLEHYDREARSV